MKSLSEVEFQYRRLQGIKGKILSLQVLWLEDNLSDDDLLMMMNTCKKEYNKIKGRIDEL